MINVALVIDAIGSYGRGLSKKRREGQTLSYDTKLAAWLKGLPKPVGIMACNDLCGRHILAVCQELALHGTGTEDYFCSGWYFDHGTYSAPYHGCLIKDAKLGRVSAYRWHIEDAIPFKKSIRFTIQVGPWDNVRAAYATVAYWYQTQPHPVYPKPAAGGPFASESAAGAKAQADPLTNADGNKERVPNAFPKTGFAVPQPVKKIAVLLSFACSRLGL